MTNDQLTANQANSQLSTGPRTEEGKARSSQNSLKHGVFAKTIVLPGESQEEFDALLAGLRKDHKPEGETESNLVRGLAEIQWRLDRLRRYEAAATDEALETGNFESPDFGTKARLAKREEDLREACDLRQFHQMNNLAWTPEQDGFVFSLAEIDARIDFEARLEMASKTVKYPFRPNLRKAA